MDRQPKGAKTHGINERVNVPGPTEVPPVKACPSTCFFELTVYCCEGLQMGGPTSGAGIGFDRERDARMSGTKSTELKRDILMTALMVRSGNEYREILSKAA